MKYGKTFAKVPDNEIPRMIEEMLMVVKKNQNGQLRELERLRSERAPQATIKVYESQIPTTFLALLAESNNEKTPGVLLVYPYVMFPISLKPFAMLLESNWRG